MKVIQKIIFEQDDHKTCSSFIEFLDDLLEEIPCNEQTLRKDILHIEECITNLEYDLGDDEYKREVLHD